MTNIFVGLIFLFLDLNINFGRITIGLLPDFVGYYLLARGLQTLPEDADFSKARTLSLVMAVYTLVLYILNLLGLSSQLGLLSWILESVRLVVYFSILYLLNRGIGQLQVNTGKDLGAAQLRPLWLALVVLESAALILGWIPVVGAFALLGNLAVHIALLVLYYNVKKRYET